MLERAAAGELIVRRLGMSFIHYSIGGHFDPSDLESISPRHAPVPTRPLDVARVATLLASYDDALAHCVEIRDGYAYCEWSADRSGRAIEFVKRLAEIEGAIILESPMHEVSHPPEAVQRFVTATKARRETRERA